MVCPPGCVCLTGSLARGPLLQRRRSRGVKLWMGKEECEGSSPGEFGLCLLNGDVISSAAAPFASCILSVKNQKWIRVFYIHFDTGGNYYY